MNRIELKRNLDLLNVNPKHYSLTGELSLDAIILFQNYNIWEVFYLDERGEKMTRIILRQKLKHLSLFIIDLELQ